MSVFKTIGEEVEKIGKELFSIGPETKIEKGVVQGLYDIAEQITKLTDHLHSVEEELATMKAKLDEGKAYYQNPKESTSGKKEKQVLMEKN